MSKLPTARPCTFARRWESAGAAGGYGTVLGPGEGGPGEAQRGVGLAVAPGCCQRLSEPWRWVMGWAEPGRTPLSSRCIWEMVIVMV